VAAGLLWAGALVTWLEGSRAAVAALDLLLVTTVGVVGLALTHGRWARHLLGLVVAYEVLLAAFRPIDLWWWVASAGSAAAAIALLGPSLDTWVRRAPRADAPPNPAVLAPLIMLATPTVVALSGRVGLAGWLLVGTSIIGAWSYARAHTVTLWALRFGYVPVGLWAAAQAGLAGLIIVVPVGTVGALLWSSGARTAVEALEPRRVSVRPVFPEMAPPEVLDAAGYDERGRRRS